MEIEFIRLHKSSIQFLKMILKQRVKEKGNLSQRRDKSKSSGTKEQPQKTEERKFQDIKKKSSLGMRTVKNLRKTSTTPTLLQPKRTPEDTVAVSSSADNGEKNKEINIGITRKINSRRSSLM